MFNINIMKTIINCLLFKISKLKIKNKKQFF